MDFHPIFGSAMCGLIMKWQVCGIFNTNQ